MQDLELNTLFNAMALGDKFLLEVAKAALFTGCDSDLDTLLYRQRIIQDCLKHSSIVTAMYEIALDAIERERKSYFRIFSRYSGSTLQGAIEVLQIFVDMLKKLKQIADKNAGKFESQGFVAFFAMLKSELTDDYFAEIEGHLKDLRFRDGVLISARLGKGNKGTQYVLRKPTEQKQNWFQRIWAEKPPAYTFQLHPRDEAGARVLAEMRDRGINLVANALAQSADHILNFMTLLRAELAFYVGCLNLHGQLTQMGSPTCFPVPKALGECCHRLTGLYDVTLALSMKRKIVGNNVNAGGKNLVIITGANQGGKSTFLRSIGLAQLMMQCGMFAPAESFYANVCDGVFTHYKREEDTSMTSGKFDEELSRMSDIVDALTPNSMVLFNESFAATNEREGAEIAAQILTALVEKRVKVFFVTHSYDLASRFHDNGRENALFLRADRRADGTRPFKLIEGAPLQTSYGEDLYKRIFETENRANPTSPSLRVPEKVQSLAK